MRTTILCLSGVLGLLVSLTPCRSAEGGAEQAVDTYLQELGAEGYNILPAHGPYLSDTFPSYKFFGVYFSQWPVEVEPPPGLAQSNVFYVNRATREVNYLTSPDELRQFFVDYFNQIVRVNAGSHVLAEMAKSWLELSQQFSQDGFFQFSKATVQVVGTTAYASVTVVEGGEGYISVTLTFTPVSGLSVQEERNVVPGERPI